MNSRCCSTSSTSKKLKCGATNLRLLLIALISLREYTLARADGPFRRRALRISRLIFTALSMCVAVCITACCVALF